VHNDDSFLQRRVGLDLDAKVAGRAPPCVADSIRVDRLPVE
jgi:hypothetical protein